MTPRPRPGPALPPALLPVVVYAGVLVVVAVVFERVRGNAAVWDDDLLAVSNPYLRSWRGVTTLVTTDIWTASAKHEPSSFYRPLPMVSYLVNARLLGATALAFHAVNVALHVLNAWLLLALLRARRLAAGYVLPLFTALAFALAPVDVEAVAWISGRFDLLGTAFVLGALLANGRTGWGATARVVALVGLGLLCKESFALGSVLVVLDDVLVLRRPFHEGLRKYALLGVAVGVFLALRSAAGVMSLDAVTGTGFRTLLESFAFLLATYARALVAPRVLDPFRPYRPFDPAETWAILAAVVFLGNRALKVQRLHWRDPRGGAVVMGLGWILVGFAPVTLTGPNLEMVGDRYAYFPLLGAFFAACPLAALAADAVRARVPSPRVRHGLALAAAAVGLVVLGAACARTRARLLDWRSERTLFEASLRDDPTNAYALYSLGFLDATEGRLPEADRLLTAALDRKPGSWRTLNALCFVRLNQGRLRKAEDLCKESIGVNPSNPRAWVNLASAYVNGQRWPQGVEASSRAIQLKPEAPEPRYLRAVCLANLGDLAGARQDLDEALAHAPDHAGARDLVRQLDAREGP
jgi:tetratricopeptide (TPR) repeat protein